MPLLPQRRRASTAKPPFPQKRQDVCLLPHTQCLVCTAADTVNNLDHPITFWEMFLKMRVGWRTTGMMFFDVLYLYVNVKELLKEVTQHGVL